MTVKVMATINITILFLVFTNYLLIIPNSSTAFSRERSERSMQLKFLTKLNGWNNRIVGFQVLANFFERNA